MASFINRQTQRFQKFRSDINRRNFRFVLGGIFAACVGFLFAVAVFNRTIITWISAAAPPAKDRVYVNSHPGVFLGWLSLTVMGLLVELVGSLWLALQAFRFVWHRRPK